MNQDYEKIIEYIYIYIYIVEKCHWVPDILKLWASPGLWSGNICLSNYPKFVGGPSAEDYELALNSGDSPDTEESLELSCNGVL